jgi:hypothetical protein
LHLFAESSFCNHAIKERDRQESSVDPGENFDALTGCMYGLKMSLHRLFIGYKEKKNVNYTTRKQDNILIW